MVPKSKEDRLVGGRRCCLRSCVDDDASVVKSGLACGGCDGDATMTAAELEDDLAAAADSIGVRKGDDRNGEMEERPWSSKLLVRHFLL